MHDTEFTATASNEVVNVKDPNRRLVAAILLRAVQDVRLNDKNAGHISKAENWFNSESDSPFSFIWSCHILGRDIESTRRKALSK
jgi:hypothetical protein